MSRARVMDPRYSSRCATCGEQIVGARDRRLSCPVHRSGGCHPVHHQIAWVSETREAHHLGCYYVLPRATETVYRAKRTSICADPWCERGIRVGMPIRFSNCGAVHASHHAQPTEAEREALNAEARAKAQDRLARLEG